MYISITGLKPKGLMGFLKFWRIARLSLRQAHSARGNLFCKVKMIRGYQCTLTAWVDKNAMLDFIRGGYHLKAIQSFHDIATGKTYGFESKHIPEWKEAFELLQLKGIKY